MSSRQYYTVFDCKVGGPNSDPEPFTGVIKLSRALEPYELDDKEIISVIISEYLGFGEDPSMLGLKVTAIWSLH